MAKRKQERRGAKEAHRDPISGEPGAHPLGVGLGAAGAATAGAAVGSLGGPVTAVLGASLEALPGRAPLKSSTPPQRTPIGGDIIPIDPTWRRGDPMTTIGQLTGTVGRASVGMVS
jgi:hypothetical protein